MDFLKALVIFGLAIGVLSSGESEKSDSETNDEAKQMEIVVLRRRDGRLNFERSWNEYRNGFGDFFGGDYFAGLQDIYGYTTNGGMTSLQVTMVDWNGRTYYARYEGFRVGPESGGYQLNVGSYQSRQSTAPDSLSYHNGMRFSAYDRDLDRSPRNCARDYRGGFWYNNCAQTNPTGLYLTGGAINPSGITWRALWNNDYSFREMTWILRG